MQYEVMDTDVLIVGAGPAGLSAAIRLAQLAQTANTPISIMVLEKGANVGAHIISGAVLEPRALDELFPDWRKKKAPLDTAVTSEAMWWLTKSRAMRLPQPSLMHNHGNYIISLGRFCEWLSVQAEALGVQVMCGFAAAENWIENGVLQGVFTGAFGVDKEGNTTANYQPPIAIRAKYTLFAEGCRGSLSESLMRQFHLRDSCAAQTYGLGIKELWQVPSGQTQVGKVEHMVGWPLAGDTYGGAFIYHLDSTTVAIGMVIGLDYSNPHLDPFKEMQRFKTHPYVRKLLANGKRISYGARALNEGGLQSLPKLVFAGGALIGCAAGFLNVPKIKGTHTAMKSGMLAAEAVFTAISAGKAQDTLEAYPAALETSWVMDELRMARNIRPAFQYGKLAGMVYSAFDMMVLRGNAPWTLSHHRSDHATLKLAKNATPIAYDAPDGVLTFDRMSSVFLSGTNHTENQPCHLMLKDSSIPILHNLANYDAPEQRYCPAGVYEIISKDASPALQINAQNCVHCKTCDIKDPTQNIIWQTPEGSGGPNYQGM
jgi:electron-transferring-flavoprotein dehydrogenase